METISTAVNAASKAIWGEQKNTTEHNETAGQEPVSGVEGKGTANEPFDQGNSDNPTSVHKTHPASNRDTSNILSETGIAPLKPTNTAQGDASDFDKAIPICGDRPTSTTTSDKDKEPSLPFDHVPTSYTASNPDPSKTMPQTTSSPFNNTSQGGATDRSQETNRASIAPETSTSGSSAPYNPNNAAQGGVDPYKSTDKTGAVSGRAGDTKIIDDVVPTERASNPGAAPDSGAALPSRHQGADNPHDAPTGDQESAVKDKKDDAEEILKNRDPNDHSGEPMKMHDGPEHKPTTQEERRTSKVGNPGGQEHGKEPKGTGEEWVRTSGLATDGGDFDATKPGAGREADRLLEEKGIKKTEPGHAAENTTTSTAHTDETEKESIGSRLKNKLHIGHSHKK